ncbi:MAG TPA: HD domain-containing phosphohydrolase [Pirellulales bacterium]|jgi:putative two-component system response regulator
MSASANISPPIAFEQLIAAQDAVILALLAAIDEPVGGDGRHVLRVQHYSQLLAEQLQSDGVFRDEIDATFLENLYRSSALHDIGKIGVDHRILSKPGRLTDDEFEIIQTHVTIGANLLKRAVTLGGDSCFLSMAIDVALYHHEHFDGRGYRAGLKGSEIPLAARIVAVADVYDAVTSQRVYKPASSSDSARELIESEAGRHFDPAVVDAFRARSADFAALVESRAPSAQEAVTRE